MFVVARRRRVSRQWRRDPAKGVLHLATRSDAGSGAVMSRVLWRHHVQLLWLDGMGLVQCTMRRC